MEKEYSIGELARTTRMSAKAIRIYEEKGIIKSHRNPTNNYRVYKEETKITLQRVKMLRYLGFSLDSIVKIVRNLDDVNLSESFLAQKRMLEAKRAEIDSMVECMDKAAEQSKHADLDVDDLLDALNNIVLNQRADDGVRKISRLSDEPRGWSRFIWQTLPLEEGMSVLDAGAGYGNLWRYNIDRLPANLSITCVDKHGTHADTFSQVVKDNPAFTFLWDDLETMSFPATYDRIYFNHVVFFMKDAEQMYRKLAAALNPGGTLACTWGGCLFCDNVAAFLSRVLPAKKDIIKRKHAEQVARVEIHEQCLRTVFPNATRLAYEISLCYQTPEDFLTQIEPLAKTLGVNVDEERNILLKNAPHSLTRDTYLFVCKKEDQ